MRRHFRTFHASSARQPSLAGIPTPDLLTRASAQDEYAARCDARIGFDKTWQQNDRLREDAADARRQARELRAEHARRMPQAVQA